MGVRERESGWGCVWCVWGGCVREREVCGWDVVCERERERGVGEGCVGCVCGESERGWVCV